MKDEAGMLDLGRDHLKSKYAKRCGIDIGYQLVVVVARRRSAWHISCCMLTFLLHFLVFRHKL